MHSFLISVNLVISIRPVGFHSDSRKPFFTNQPNGDMCSRLVELVLKFAHVLEVGHRLGVQVFLLFLGQIEMAGQGGAERFVAGFLPGHGGRFDDRFLQQSLGGPLGTAPAQEGKKQDQQYVKEQIPTSHGTMPLA